MHFYTNCLQVQLIDNNPVVIENSSCECKAGKGHCSHAIGLLYLLVHFLKLDLKTVPPFQCKTSLPQTWHIPQRTAGLKPKPVDSIIIQKVKPPIRSDEEQPLIAPKKVVKRTVEGIIMPSVYCPVQPVIPAISFTNTLTKQLQSISSDTQLLQILPSSSDPFTFQLVKSKFGDVPKGSVLSYQQKPDANSSGDITNIPDAPPYPWFSLPEQPHRVHIVLTNAQQEIFQGLHVTDAQSQDIELHTRIQSQNIQWHALRQQRLTSSYFKDIYSRKKDHETLASRLIKGKKVQTQAMRYGIEHEPEAAKLYAELLEIMFIYVALLLILLHLTLELLLTDVFMILQQIHHLVYLKLKTC